MKIQNQKGGVFVFVLIVLWLILFSGSIFAFFLYKAGYMRVKFGFEEKIGIEVFNKNTIETLKKNEALLSEREKDLEEKEKRIHGIMEQINIEKQIIEKKRSKITVHLNEISSFFEEFSAEEKENLKKLAKMYEAMKPVKVASIFNELEIETVAELLKRMKNRSSAKILGEIGQANAHKAAEISKMIQGKEKAKTFSQVAQ